MGTFLLLLPQLGSSLSCTRSIWGPPFAERGVMLELVSLPGLHYLGFNTLQVVACIPTCDNAILSCGYKMSNSNTWISHCSQLCRWEPGNNHMQCINHYRRYKSSTYHGSPSEVHSSLSRARWAVVCMNEPARMGQYGVELNGAPENCTANVSDLWYT